MICHRQDCRERNIARARKCEAQSLLQTIERNSTQRTPTDLTQLLLCLALETDIELLGDTSFEIQTSSRTWVFVRGKRNYYKAFVVANQWKSYAPSALVVAGWSVIHCASAVHYHTVVSLVLHFLFVVAVSCIILIQVRGPGLISLGSSVVSSEADRPKCTRHTIELGEDTLVLVTRRCKGCDMMRPPRASHCRQCDVCVAQFDHHCIILNSCIGRDNISPFVWLIFAALAYSCIDLLGAVLYTEEARFVSFAVIAISTFSIPPLLWASLLYARLYFLLGITFWEYRKKGDGLEGFELTNHWSEIPRPFDQGCIENFGRTMLY